VKKGPRNLAASVRARLLRLAHERGEEFQFVLMHFVLERVLYRLSISDRSGDFVLKGAMLLEALMDVRHRATKDLDLPGFGPNDPQRLVEVFRSILSTPVEPDGLEFLVDEITAEAIRDEEEYSGVRVYLTAGLDSARIEVHIDVGFGDAVTPAPRELRYPTVLDMPPPVLRAYPIETVVAEKFQILCERGMLNSRMKDYYDLWTISRRFDLSVEPLARAIAATFARRETSVPVETPLGLTTAFAEDAAKAAQWRAFLKKGRLEGGSPSLAEVDAAIEAFVMPAARLAASQG
jgi:predicted nucleotidyltransferase component of viral defense system